MSIYHLLPMFRSKKSCFSCHESKPIKEFWKDSSSKDGLRSRCRLCASSLRRKNKEAKKPARVKVTSVDEKYSEDASNVLVHQDINQVKIDHIGLQESLKNIDLPKEEAHLLEEVFQEITQKFNSHWSLSRTRKGSYRLSIHGNPQVTFKSDNLPSLFEQVLD